MSLNWFIPEKSYIVRQVQYTPHVGDPWLGIVLLHSPQLGREDGKPGLLLLGPRVGPGELGLELVELPLGVSLLRDLGGEFVVETF